MARIARIVLPGLPHLVTQRGYEGRQAFFSADDFRSYLALVAESCKRWNVTVSAYCLLPNRADLVVIPSDEDGLARALGEAHRRYARGVNARRKKLGQLWHARFSSSALEPKLLPEAARMVERGPVDAGMVEKAGDYPWSSAAARAVKKEDPLTGKALPPGPANWISYLTEPTDPALIAAFDAHLRTGRPYGGPEFIRDLEAKLKKRLRPRKRGRKPKIPRPEED
jgi:putative transposase